MRTAALLGLVALLRGGSLLPLAYALEDAGPLVVVALQVAVAAAAAALAVALAGQAAVVLRELRTRPLQALVLALAFTEVPFALTAAGVTVVPTGLASVILCAAPLWATLIAGASNRLDRPTLVQGIGLLVGICGVALVVGAGASGTADQLLGALALLAAAASFAVGGLVVRRWYQRTPILSTAFLAFAPGLPLLLVPAALTLPAAVPGARAWIAILVLGTCSSALALVAFLRVVIDVGPIRALLVGYVSPVVAVLLGIAFLGERLTAAVVGGLVVVLVGVALATRRDPRTA